MLQMTPINLVRHNSLELQQFGGDCIDDSLSMDTQDIVDQPAFTNITEIAVLNCPFWASTANRFYVYVVGHLEFCCLQEYLN